MNGEWQTIARGTTDAPAARPKGEWQTISLFTTDAPRRSPP